MALFDRQLNEVWQSLRAKRVPEPNELVEVRIRNLRGIRDLTVPLDYPVSVLAGPNGCGKSTVLFACACAYRVPERNPRDFTPSTLFPNFIGGGTNFQDSLEKTEIELHYLDQGERKSMLWRRGKSWNRSYMGRKGGKQPERQLYLRTLANLTNPSEVRSILRLSQNQLETQEVSEDMLLFAHRVLPYRYNSLVKITAQSKDLLFAELERGEESNASYSEFHMSAGERAIVRISMDISNLQDALVLIDEIEAGLHPYTQQRAMLEFQRIALRNNLQIIVASHSPVVLDSVPEEGRLFLDRDEKTGHVNLAPPHRDIIQKALYGYSRDRLSMLCEDDIAEGLLLGFMDVLNVKLRFRHDDYKIGRDTGKTEFASHVRTLCKFGQMDNFILVLDGDAKDMKNELESIAKSYGQTANLLFLPSDESPEQWIWETLKNSHSKYAKELGMPDLYQHINNIEQMLEGAVQHNGPYKLALTALAEETERDKTDIARIIGKVEAQSSNGEVRVFLAELEDRLEAWRQAGT